MNKDGSESYAHFFAKQVFVEWLRDSAATPKHEYAKFGDIEWRVNRDAPTYGVFEEYPMPDDMHCSWDEHAEWFGKEEHPDYGWMVRNHKGKFKIADIVILHKGHVLYVIEIVHKNEVSDDKLNFYKSMTIEPAHVLSVPTHWILAQTKKPMDIPKEFFIK